MLFAAILVAGAPGVIFGALQAAHSYNSASKADQVVRSDDALRASVRFDATLRAARDRVAAFAVSDVIAKGGPECSKTLRSVVQTQTLYTFIGRTDAEGHIVCSSNERLPGGTLAYREWFDAIRAGATELSAATTSPRGLPNIVVAHSLKRNGVFDGAAMVTIPRAWFARALAEDMGESPGAIAIFDRKGALVAAAARGVAVKDAVASAKTALAAQNSTSSANGLTARVVTTQAPDYAFVSVAPQGRQVEITLRAALIVLSPVLVSALSIVAIWLVLDRWLLRWFFRLRDAAEDFARGRYAPPPMDGAPAEIASLADAFETAVAQSRMRETDLESALKSNMALTRELHHRVKNNLQVLSSLISRQQRRTEEPVVRNALGEARARMAPVALAYRFISPPEDLVAIDMEAYLRELTRQLHVSLNGDARGVTLTVASDSAPMAVDDATNLGLIVAEAFVSGYGHAAGMSGATASLSSVRNEDGSHTVTVGVRSAADQSDSQRLDRELVQELARQLHAEAKFEQSGLITLTLPPRPSETGH
ncbi:MAG: histidine kinase dimerization/phosphoacceptor domain -containing protein [Alphaproteobacteria bacterium]